MTILPPSKSSREPPQKLTECKTPASQSAWVERALRAGRVLSDSGLWLSGVDHPEKVIAKLRRAGLAIETTTKRVVDAADQEHDDLAWHLTA